MGVVAIMYNMGVQMHWYIHDGNGKLFNSLKQFYRYKGRVGEYNAENPSEKVSCGLRINPMCSVVETDIYNPSSPGSRFGVIAEDINDIPEGLDGFHFHALCESTSYDLEKVLKSVEDQFGRYLPKLKWLNMGGGHLMTREGYDIEHLISLLKSLFCATTLNAFVKRASPAKRAISVPKTL